MTGRIIPLQGDRHVEVKKVLPWYAAGTLEAEDVDMVAAHLTVCADCQNELRLERRMAGLLADTATDVAPEDFDRQWAAARAAAEQSPRGRLVAARSGFAAAGEMLTRQWRGASPLFRGLLAAQAAAIVALAIVVAQPVSDARYKALGAPRAGEAANVIVKFHPDIAEANFRGALNAAHARVVGGPTAADAYLLHVPAGERDAAMTTLRGNASVSLAEPIDPGAAE